MNDVAVAVVGAGHLGSVHARILSHLPGFSLRGVADPVAASRNKLAADFGVNAFEDYRDLFGQVDAVIVATPTTWHHAVAMDFLSRGVHVFVEKPLAINYREADELLQTARAKGVVLQTGHVERFNPGLTCVAGKISEPKYIDACRQGIYSFRSADIGVVLDLMIHDLDVALALVRSPVLRVEALGVALFGGHEDVANARITFADGCVANFSASRVSREARRQMSVWWSQGMATIDFQARGASLITPSDAILTRQLQWGDVAPQDRAAAQQQILNDHLRQETIAGQPQDAITAELEEFSRCIVRGETPRVTPEQAREVIGVAERILTSIHEHSWSNSPEGPIGPNLLGPPSILHGPHWAEWPISTPRPQREAG